MENASMRTESYNKVEQDVLYPATVYAISSCTRWLSTVVPFAFEMSWIFWSTAVPWLHSYYRAGWKKSRIISFSSYTYHLQCTSFIFLYVGSEPWFLFRKDKKIYGFQMYIDRASLSDPSQHDRLSLSKRLAFSSVQLTHAMTTTHTMTTQIGTIVQVERT